MKSRFFPFCLIIMSAIEIVALIVFAVQSPDSSQDAVAVNEAVQSVTQNFYSLEKHVNTAPLDYVVLDTDGNVLYKTKSGLSENTNAAISHRDTILDITIDGTTVGKIIIRNDGAQSLQTRKKTVIAFLAIAIAIECGLCIGYAVNIRMTVIKPFRKLKGFAERVAGGNLDIPLEMDRKNLFGAFTESFDIMRSELKKSRIAEAQAQQSKKELVAKLSHDIKTPVASIKAVAEVGFAVTANEKQHEYYSQIISKADQINTLVTNLFTATLEELQQLTVSPVIMESAKIKEMLENADYLHRAAISPIPKCSVYADGLRLQQVFDNIFANSYKYADTAVSVTTQTARNNLCIIIEDFGGGVESGELPFIKEKFKRGSNSANIEGAGLGLYISDYFMKEMQGKLNIENGTHGLKVTVQLRNR